MKETIAEKRIREFSARGYVYAGCARGALRFARGTNLYRAMFLTGYDIDQVIFVTAAKLRNRRKGYEILIFALPDAIPQLTGGFQK